MSTSIPVWPFAILAVLVALGHRQSRDRVVRPGTLAAVAVVMFALSLFGVTATFGARLLPVLAWAAGFAASLLLGTRVLAPRGLVAAGDAVRVPGSWVPMGLMLGIFSAKFALGFAAGMHAAALHEGWFIALMSALFGLLSGAFAARAAAVYRFSRAVPAA